jgi:hypothetical protein
LARTFRATGVAKGGISVPQEISADITARQQNGFNGFYAGGTNRKA